MRKLILGIDIGDSQISGVVLAQQRKTVSVTQQLSLPLIEGAPLADQIHLLCQQMEWQGKWVVVGLPLEYLSVRNLRLPFRERKKIEQILPFELEDQLIAPVDSLVADFTVVESTETGSDVLAFAVEKELLHELLTGLDEVVDPQLITPAPLPLASRLVRHQREGEESLLLHVDVHSITLCLLEEGQPMLCRRLSYPEQMILYPPFFYENNRVLVADRNGAEQCIRELCQTIERSLDFFRLESSQKIRPERAFLTGPLTEMPDITELVSSALQIPVHKIDLLETLGINCPAEIRKTWRSASDDGALALAIQGLNRKNAVNFRQGEFKAKSTFLATTNQRLMLAGAVAGLGVFALGMLWYDQGVLGKQDEALKKDMAAVYKKAFPEVSRVQDAHMEMEGKMRNSAENDTAAPMLFSEQRTLSLLTEISARIPANIKLKVQRLTIDRTSVLIKGTTDTFNSVNSMKNSLSESDRYATVQILSATADKNKKNSVIRFEIQLQLAEV